MTEIHIKEKDYIAKPKKNEKIVKELREYSDEIASLDKKC